MATLTIPKGVIPRDVIGVSSSRKYIAANAIGWYKFVNKVGDRHATNGDLRIVVGWDHCSSWSRVTTSSIMVHVPDDSMETSKYFARFDLRATGGGTGVLEPMVGRELLQGGAVYQNQFVFLRTLNISVFDNTWSKLAEYFRPHVEPYIFDGTLSSGNHARLCVSFLAFSDGTSYCVGDAANRINALLLKQV